MQRQLQQWYTEDGISIAISVLNFPEDWTHSPNIIIKSIRYFYMFGGKTKHKIHKLDEKIDKIFDHFIRMKNRPVAVEIADIFQTYTGNRKYIEAIERYDHRAHQPPVKLIQKTVYRDSQNVHNSKINQTVIQSAEKMCEKYKHILHLESELDEQKNLDHKHMLLDNIQKILTENYPDKKVLVSESIKYIKDSISVFGNGITMQDVFISVWIFISEHKDFDELKSRLLEELSEMNGQCSTGHIARIMNVIQGFVEDENLHIRISEKDQCTAVVKQYLAKELSECDDERVSEGLLDGNEIFVKFIKDKIRVKILEWQKSYGKNMLTEIAKTVNDFSGIKIFHV